MVATKQFKMGGKGGKGVKGATAATSGLGKSKVKKTEDKGASKEKKEDKPVVKLPPMLIRVQQVRVAMQVVILKIGEIDYKMEAFTAQIYVQAKWREPLLDNTKGMQSDDPRWEMLWKPLIHLEDTNTKVEEKFWSVVQFIGKQAYVCERRTIKTQFRNEMHLDHFPFDTQELTVTVSSERTAEEVMLIRDEVDLSTIDVESFTDKQHWRLYAYINFKSGELFKESGNKNQIFPCIHVRCHVSRNWGYYFWNVYVLLIFFVGLTFTCFSVTHEDVDNRITIMVTLFLTLASLKLSIEAVIPEISYMTYMDYYIVSMYFLMTAVGVWMSLLRYWVGEYSATSIYKLDKCALVIYGSFYVIDQVLYWVEIYFHVLRKRQYFKAGELYHKKQVSLRNAFKHKKDIDEYQVQSPEYSISMRV